MILIHKDCGGTITEHNVLTFPSMRVRTCGKCGGVERVNRPGQIIELEIESPTSATATASYVPFNEHMNNLTNGWNARSLVD